MKKNYEEPEIEILFLSNSSDSQVFTTPSQGLEGGEDYGGDGGIEF